MSNTRFASTPNITIPRSRFHQPFNHSTSFNHGKLIPIDCFEVLPGDTYKAKMSSLIWMSNPIVPLFGNIHADVYAFFVPMRLVWNFTEQFYTGVNTTTGAKGDVSIPFGPLNNSGSNIVDFDSVSHYLGKPVSTSLNTKASGVTKVSVLKERGYYLIHNEYYRAQQVQAPVVINKSNTGSIGSVGDSVVAGGQTGTLNFGSKVFNVNKEFDYFTSATLSPQFGDAVSLPLGSYAPLVTQSDVYDFIGGANQPVLKSDAGAQGYLFSYGSDNILSVYRGNPTSSPDIATKTNIVADLTNATAATITQLQYAFAVQKYLQRSNFGNRFYEMLNVHYGVTSPDASLQIPQRLGHGRINIVVNSVLSTAGASDDNTTKLGQPGAVSCSARKDMNLFTRSFTEPGYVYIMLSTKHERSYSQGILREDLKANRFEFYSPEFANIGDQEILKAEICMTNSSADKDVFGYQEAWAEYKYRPNRVSGLLDPAYSGSLDFWTLGDVYAAAPVLGSSFLIEDRTAISRALVTGDIGPDYIGDFYLDYVATREMPLFPKYLTQGDFF